MVVKVMNAGEQSDFTIFEDHVLVRKGKLRSWNKHTFLR